MSSLLGWCHTAPSWSTSAPFSSRCITQSKCPFLDAQIRGVVPYCQSHKDAQTHVVVVFVTCNSASVDAHIGCHGWTQGTPPTHGHTVQQLSNKWLWFSSTQFVPKQLNFKLAVWSQEQWDRNGEKQCRSAASSCCYLIGTVDFSSIL